MFPMKTNIFTVLNLTFTPTVWHTTSTINIVPKWDITCLLSLRESNWSSNFQPSIFWCYLSSGQASKLIQIDGCPSSLAELFSFYLNRGVLFQRCPAPGNLMNGLKRGSCLLSWVPGLSNHFPTFKSKHWTRAGVYIQWTQLQQAPARPGGLLDAMRQRGIFCWRCLWKTHDVSMGNIHPKRWGLLPFSYHHY